MTPTKLTLTYGNSKTVVALHTADDGYLEHDYDGAAYADVEIAIGHFQEGDLVSGLIVSDFDNSVVSFEFSDPSTSPVLEFDERIESPDEAMQYCLDCFGFDPSITFDSTFVKGMTVGQYISDEGI